MNFNPDFWLSLPWWAWALWATFVVVLSIYVSIKVVRFRDRVIAAPDRLADKVAARVLAGGASSIDKVLKG